jgi:hypothetical protein
MVNYCKKCKQEFDCSEKKCPICGTKLVKEYTEEELERMQKENDTYAVLNTMFFSGS